jgi:hypothetical protein
MYLRIINKYKHSEAISEFIPLPSKVLEEEELVALRSQQEKFERQRMQELLEVQRLEAAEKRRQEEAVRFSLVVGGSTFQMLS